MVKSDRPRYFAGDRLRELMDRTGETYRSLESKIGKSYTTISKWAKGRVPTYGDIELLSSYFQVSDSYFTEPPEERGLDAQLLEDVIRIVDEILASHALQLSPAAGSRLKRLVYEYVSRRMTENQRVRVVKKVTEEIISILKDVQ